MTDDLAAFITARLGEDEATARAATPGPWVVYGFLPYVAERISGDGGRRQVIAGSRYEGESSVFENAADAVHIARHDPARVLREVAAMRAILAEHRPGEITDKWTVCHRCADWEPGTFYGDEEEGEWPEDSQGRMSWPCPTLLRLAYIWSDHPGYRAEWKRAHINYRAEWKP